MAWTADRLDHADKNAPAVRTVRGPTQCKVCARGPLVARRSADVGALRLPTTTTRQSWKTLSFSSLPGARRGKDEAGETRALVNDRFNAQGAIFEQVVMMFAASRVAVRTLAEIQRVMEQANLTTIPTTYAGVNFSNARPGQRSIKSASGGIPALGARRGEVMMDGMSIEEWGGADPDKRLTDLRKSRVGLGPAEINDDADEWSASPCLVCKRPGVPVESLGPDCWVICPEDMRCWIIGAGLFSAWMNAPLPVKERDRTILRRCTPIDPADAQYMPAAHERELLQRTALEQWDDIDGPPA